MSYILVLGDAHVGLGQSLERFDWLGNMIVTEKPDVIINLGDFGSYDSLSTYEKPGSKGDRAKPYLIDEIKLVEEAHARMFGPMQKYNDGRRKNRHPRYTPDLIFLKGNHEERWDRMESADPITLSGVQFDEQFLQWYDDVYQFKDWYVTHGIGFTHVPHNKMGRPIGGVTRCRAIGTQSPRHVVFGHTHSVDFTSIPLVGPDNRVRVVLNAPAFMPHNHIEAYAKHTQSGWMYGVLRIYPSPVHTEPFSFDFVSMDRLRSQYGSK